MYNIALKINYELNKFFFEDEKRDILLSLQRIEGIFQRNPFSDER